MRHSGPRSGSFGNNTEVPASCPSTKVNPQLERERLVDDALHDIEDCTRPLAERHIAKLNQLTPVLANMLPSVPSVPSVQSTPRALRRADGIEADSVSGRASRKAQEPLQPLPNK